jgi:hypothetical protein
MRLFRSEEAEDGDGPDGVDVPVEQLAALARDWYADRLDPAWRPRSLAESQAILERHGLTGPFWALA